MNDTALKLWVLLASRGGQVYVGILERILGWFDETREAMIITDMILWGVGVLK